METPCVSRRTMGMRRGRDSPTGEGTAVCDVTDAVMFELPHNFEAPSDARGLVEQNLCPLHGRAALGPAQVLVSELALCGVLYGKPPIVLDLACAESRVRVAVTHRAAGSLVREIPIDEDGGLRSGVLARLSRAWGVDRGPEARTLWCSLPTGAVPEPVRTVVPARDGHPV